MTDDTILICARVEGPLMLPDNLVGKCDECGRLVEYRPHAPPSIKRCIQCMAQTIQPGDELGTTLRMIEDAQAYLRRKKQ